MPMEMLGAAKKCSLQLVDDSAREQLKQLGNENAIGAGLLVTIGVPVA